MKILVIEDEKLLADSIKAMLEAKGFQVEVAYNGEDGLAFAELGLYDLLILDVMMPKLDGFEVARRVRKSRCNTPILMLTARSDVQDRIAGLNAGADYYLTKPFDSGELLASINATCADRRDRSTSCPSAIRCWIWERACSCARGKASVYLPRNLMLCASSCSRGPEIFLNL